MGLDTAGVPMLTTRDEFATRGSSDDLDATQSKGARAMSRLRSHISVSADGFVAGANQSADNPLGEGGERLHDWVVSLASWREAHGMEGGEVNESSRIVEETIENVGAAVMGRKMFGPPGGGDWGDGDWKGWWGDNPPYHYDVYVLTHHPRDPVEMEGGTTFHFVTDGIESALERAKESAGDQDVMLWGGAQAINQYLAAGLLDEIELHIVPVLLGDGARLFDDLGGAQIELEQVRAVAAPGVTHVKYAVNA
jgi:dihydrofolate reductase